MLTDSGFGCYMDSEKIQRKPATVALLWGQSVPGFELISERYVCLTQLYTQTLVKRTSTLARKRKKERAIFKEF